VGEKQWHPVLPVDDRGLVLGVAKDGAWVVSDGDGELRSADAALMALLPLLERPFHKVAAAVAVQAGAQRSAPPWAALVRCALVWPTEYWPGLALGWLEEGYPTDGLVEVLAGLKDAPGRSQPLRRRALRLWKAVRRAAER
jgi:hypothetical protein